MILSSGPVNCQTEEEWQRFEEYLRKTLVENTSVKVTFIKQDGTERVMNCTLNEAILPKREVKENTTPRKQSTTSLPVYDLDKKEWRSFTIRSVKEFTFEVNYGEAIPHIS